MSLTPGTRLGAYEIRASLGTGGMGEVYRATDSHLGRDVAIKVLPDAFAEDAERLARFEREARTLASLNHPNIAIVHGFEAVDAPAGSGRATIRALVMELVDGPTLADRIAIGPVPLDEALPIATQIADALEAAHEHGIIHRDLKPANIKIRPDGRVKVLDFGLAKAMAPAALLSGVSISPTITSPAMTEAGMILGTAAYMSPEQARGKPADRRSDIWAFGCILFELLAGRRMVGDEETVSDTLAAILKSDPDWDALPRDTPPRIRTLLERCLRKDLRRRLPDIAEARIQIEDSLKEPANVVAVSPHRSYTWPVIAALVLVAAANIAWWIARGPDRFDPVTVRVEIPAPPGARALSDDGRMSEVGQPISPDGRSIAFVATYEGRRMLWLRPLDSSVSRPLAGTEGVSRSAWSPDSKWLAFIVRGELKKVAADGGPATTIAATDGGRDVAWGPGDTILIGGRDQSQSSTGPAVIRRVSATTGVTTRATVLGPNETTHDYPEFLPDGRHFLYLARHGATQSEWDVYVGSLDSNDRKVLPGIHAGVRYSPTGHLLFLIDRTLMVQRFDARRLELNGEAFAGAEGLVVGPKPPFSVAANGSLAYLAAAPRRDMQLAWFDRRGNQLAIVAAPDQYDRLRLSPDGRSLAFDRSRDVFVLDLGRGATTRLVGGDAGDIAPVWADDGKSIVYASSRDPLGNISASNPLGANLYQRSAGGAAKDELLWKKTATGKLPTDWSRTGFLAFTSVGDVWAMRLPMAANMEPLRVTQTPSSTESDARFSPDGQWIAYESDESGRPEIWIQSFPDSAVRQPVSTNGGSAPRWARGGRELFYVAPDLTLMSVSITSTATGLTLGTPRKEFQSRAFEAGADYDVSVDGRFLLKVPLGDALPPLVVIHNWRPEKRAN